MERKVSKRSPTCGVYEFYFQKVWRVVDEVVGGVIHCTYIIIGACCKELPQTIGGNLILILYTSIETALCQNELLDIFRPDLPAPQEEERLFGDKSDNFIKEFQSFTDLEHSKNKAISAIDWMPNAKGMVAVACADNISFDERIYRQSGFMKPAVILIWNFVDPIHPQLILEAPSDVQSLRFNPQKGHILVAGCSNGQVLYYDLTGELFSCKICLESPMGTWH